MIRRQALNTEKMTGRKGKKTGLATPCEVSILNDKAREGEGLWGLKMEEQGKERNIYLPDRGTKPQQLTR